MSEKNKYANNSQVGTCWITNSKETKKIKKEDINLYLNSEWHMGRTMPKNFNDIMSVVMTGKKYKSRSKEHSKKLKIFLKGHIPWNKNKSGMFSDETIQKMRNVKLGKIRSPRSEETKRKIRLTAIQYRKDNDLPYMMAGKNEKELLDKQEIKDHCKIIRNYEIKELGYFPDGYCKETNTVYEVYERYHTWKVFKDLERENKICRYLGCDFVIIYDRTH